MSVHQECDVFMDRLKKTLELAAKYGSEDDKDPEQFKNMANSVCTAELKYQNMQAIFDTADTFDNVNTLITQFKAQEGKKVQSGETSERYKRFVRDANGIISAFQMVNDPKQESAGTSRIQDDDFIMEDVLCDIDPITKAPLQNPVRNKKCRHIYGRDSITESLNMNPRLRCPIMGCQNRDTIKLTDLVDDEEYARKLFVARQKRS